MKLIKNSKKYEIAEMLWEMIRSRFLEDNGIRIIDKTGERFSDNYNNYFNDLCGLGDGVFYSNVMEVMMEHCDESAYEIMSFDIKSKKKFKAIKTKFGFDCKDQNEFDQLQSFKIDPCDLMEGMEKFNWCAVPIEEEEEEV